MSPASPATYTTYKYASVRANTRMAVIAGVPDHLQQVGAKEAGRRTAVLQPRLEACVRYVCPTRAAAVAVASCQNVRDARSVITNKLRTLPPKPHASMLWLEAAKNEKSDTPPARRAHILSASELTSLLFLTQMTKQAHRHRCVRSGASVSEKWFVHPLRRTTCALHML